MPNWNFEVDEVFHREVKAQAALNGMTLKDYVTQRIQSALNQSDIGYNEWKLQAIEEGIRQADAGDVIPHEDIKATWLKKREDLLD
jgi:hypothetical protein